ncbi:MAG: MFS transporter [Acidimicrobiales bacterium]
MSASAVQLSVVETKIPSRLDRLPWSRFHWRIIIGLGTAWILDGLEVTIVGSIASRLTSHGSGIAITTSGIGIAAGTYVAGACVGALIFGHLTDRFGRKKLFMITLGLYMVATAVTALSFAAWFFFLFRFLTGMGIGGEYAAINSAIDELIPARARGRVDLVVNGSFWVGSICGSALAILFLDQSIFPTDVGWRLSFAIGIVLATIVLLVRRHVPESPRWLFIHGREQEAEELVDAIEADVTQWSGQDLEPVDKVLKVRQRATIGFGEIARVAFTRFPRRSILCLALFVGQAFIYNGITFNLGSLMSTFFHVASGAVPVFLIVYAAANFLGPVVLGRLFDTIGRKQMISGTYLISAALGLVLAGLFFEHVLDASWPFIVVVMATFFIASAGASAAYLTSSEIFPMETRALAIAFFYAIGTAIGGIAGPLLFGPLIATKARGPVALAFVIGAVLMVGGGVFEMLWGVRAEGVQLEDIAEPLTAETASDGGRQAPDAEPPVASATPEAQVWLHRSFAHDHHAEAAEHRARSFELLEEPGVDVDATAETERALSAIEEAIALAEEEKALAADEMARGPASDGSGPDRDAMPREARYRSAQAALLRAKSHEEDAASLGSQSDGEAQAYGYLASASLERARGAEQAALAIVRRARARSDDTSQDDGVVDRQAARMHELWAETHAARAVVLEMQASGNGDVDWAHQRADRAATLAQAAVWRLEALERRAAAKEAKGRAGETSPDGYEAVSRAEARAEQQRARVQARLSSTERRERSGARRYRPGQGRLGAAPGTVLGPAPEEALDREIVALERALLEHGPTEQRELERLVGARYWGPGVFGEALRQAVAERGAVRLSRRVYGPGGADGEQPSTEMSRRDGRGTQD